MYFTDTAAFRVDDILMKADKSGPVDFGPKEGGEVVSNLGQ